MDVNKPQVPVLSFYYDAIPCFSLRRSIFVHSLRLVRIPLYHS